MGSVFFFTVARNICKRIVAGSFDVVFSPTQICWDTYLGDRLFRFHLKCFQSFFDGGISTSKHHCFTKIAFGHNNMLIRRSCFSNLTEHLKCIDVFNYQGLSVSVIYIFQNWGHFVEVWLHQTSFSTDNWWCYACYTSVVKIYLWYHQCLRPPQAFHLGTACICMCFFMFCSEKPFLEYRSQYGLNHEMTPWVAVTTMSTPFKP